MLEKKLFLLSPNVMSITHSVLLFCVSTFHIQLLQYKMYYSNIPKVDAILVKPSSFCDSKCLVSLIFVLIFVYKENEKLIVLLCKILVFKSVLCYRVFRYKVLRKYHLYNDSALQVTITNWTNYSNQFKQGFCPIYGDSQPFFYFHRTFCNVSHSHKVFVKVQL